MNNQVNPKKIADLKIADLTFKINFSATGI